MYGHIHKLAIAEKQGIEAAGGTADLYQYVIKSLVIPLLQVIFPACKQLHSSIQDMI